MKTNRKFLPGLCLFLFLVLLTSLTIYQSQQPPNALPVSAPLTEFSADRMPLAREYLPKNRTNTVVVSKAFMFP